VTMIEKTFPLIEKQILSLLPLVELLYQQINQEAEILKQAQQAELIGFIASNKNQLVAQIERVSRQLSELLALEKLPNNQEGISLCFQRAEAAGFSTLEAARSWAQIVQLSADCKALNERNGACIDLLSRHAKRSLQILKGKPQIGNTYGPDGIAEADYLGRTIISV
jgi:flagella synthesis protein FlgN